MRKNSEHQIATILFADIVGYTALMQENEQLAMSKLQQFKTQLETNVATYKGKIIQFYGDGCLVLFDNPVLAVQCAENIQTIFIEQLNIPVRIGMHYGDVLSNEDNVYGHAVNITSRVESMGIGGSILMTKQLREQIKTTSKFQVVPLGNFEFKNVKETLHIYALANAGLPIPKREELKGKLRTISPKNKRFRFLYWLIPSLIAAVLSFLLWQTYTNKSQLNTQILKERIAVLPFKNNTNDPTLETLGEMAADWINTGLMDIGEAEVVSPFTVRTHKQSIGILENDPQNRPSFAQLTGAKNLITGNYYKEKGDLIFKLEIVDALDGNLHFSFHEIRGKVSNKEALITQLREQVTGYWAARELVDAKKITAPNFEAYELYLATIQKLGTEKDLLKILALDSTFYLSRIHFLYVNRGETIGKNRSHFEFLERHKPNLSSYEKTWLTYLNAICEGQTQKAFNSLNKLRNKYPKDFLVNNATAAIALEGLNNPELALEIYKELPLEDSQAESVGLYWNYRILHVVTSLIMLNNLADAATYLATVQPNQVVDNNSYLRAVMFEALANKNKEKIAKAYTQLKASFKTKPFHYFWLALNLTQSTLASEAFRQQVAEDIVTAYDSLAPKHPQRFLWQNTIALLRNDTASISDSNMKAIPISLRIPNIAAAAALYIDKKQVEKAYLVLDKLKPLTICNHTTQSKVSCAVAYYYLGSLQLRLGETEQAIENLKKGKELGVGGRLSRYQFDRRLQPLFEKPIFQEIIQPIWPIADQSKVRVLDVNQYIAATKNLENRTADFKKNDKIQLASGDRYFNLKLGTTNNFNSPEIKYHYQLKGIDKEWSVAEKGDISISGLPYGKQTLSIKALFPNGRFTKEILKIPILVNKPFYLKTWFLLLSGLSLFLGIQLWTRNLQKQKERLEQEVAKRTLQINKQAEELRQLDKVKSNFFANVSHELRTPITLILGPLDKILKSKNLNPKELKLLQLIQQNGQNLQGLVNEILDLTKMDAGKLVLEEQPVPVYLFLHRLVSTFDSFAENKNINLSFSYQGSQRLQVLVDKGKFEKIINNLLSNALKFTPERGKVGILFEDLGHSLQIEISDTGKGIHPDDLPHIFNRFYQSKQANPTLEGGTGIGLALVQQFAKLFGGEIIAESEVGQGSRFIFTFPKKQVLKPLEEKKVLAIESLANRSLATAKKTIEKIVPLQTNIIQEKQPINNTANKPIILVVEDNPQLREYIQLILEDQYQIQTAENGRIALEHLAKKETATLPDLIISDLMMPVLNGFDLLTILKNNDKYRAIPIVMLTARADVQDKLTALRIGVDDYMLKPFIEDELLVRIDNLLNLAQERKQVVQATQLAAAPPLQVTNATNKQEKEKFPLPNPKGNISAEDLEWLADVERKVLTSLKDFEFTLETLGTLLYLSPRQTRRKLKQLTGLSFSQYLKEARFREARRLLELREVKSVKQLTYKIGLRDVKYFSQQFKAHYGKSPSAYLV